MKFNNISYFIIYVIIFLNDVYIIINGWYNKKFEKMILFFIVVYDLIN